MPVSNPTILALDFDGVLCDGLKEYFQTSWRAYCDLWQPDDREPPSGLDEKFYRTRPVILTGWEMPVLIRALLLGISEAEIFQNWGSICSKLVTDESLDSMRLSAEVDGIRDRWIATDLDGWLAEHNFYPGVIGQLRSWLADSVQPIIISTKEGRFIQQLLRQQGIEPASLKILGKEVKSPKHQVLRLMQEANKTATIWFVEDRLESLQIVRQQPDLRSIKLFLADWGYNTRLERESVVNDPDITLLTLPQFCQDFSTWLP